MTSLGSDTLTSIMNSDKSFRNIYWDGPPMISNWLGYYRNSVPFLWFVFARYVMKNKLNGLSSDQIVINELLLSYASEFNWNETKTKILTLSNEYQMMNVCHAFCVKLFACGLLYEAEDCQDHWQKSIDIKELNERDYEFYCILYVKAKDSETVYNYIKEDEQNIFMSDKFQKFDVEKYLLSSNIYQSRIAKMILEICKSTPNEFLNKDVIRKYCAEIIPSYNIFNYSGSI